MTWDDKMLELLFETESGPCGTNGWGWKYSKPYSPPAGVNIVWRYWLKPNGEIHRWVIGRDRWRVVKSPRMRKALMLAAWPNWEPVTSGGVAYV